MRVRYYLDPASSHELVRRINRQHEIDQQLHQWKRSAHNLVPIISDEESVAVKGVVFTFTSFGIRHDSKPGIGGVPPMLKGAPIIRVEVNSWQREQPAVTSYVKAGTCEVNVRHRPEVHHSPDDELMAHGAWYIEVSGASYDEAMTVHQEVAHGAGRPTLSSLPPLTRSAKEREAIEVLQQAVLDGRLSFDQIAPYLADPYKKYM